MIVENAHQLRAINEKAAVRDQIRHFEMDLEQQLGSIESLS